MQDRKPGDAVAEMRQRAGQPDEILGHLITVRSLDLHGVDGQIERTERFGQSGQVTTVLDENGDGGRRRTGPFLHENPGDDPHLRFGIRAAKRVNRHALIGAGFPGRRARAEPGRPGLEIVALRKHLGERPVDPRDKRGRLRKLLSSTSDSHGMPPTPRRRALRNSAMSALRNR